MEVREESTSVTIVVDALGGDDAPGVVLEGVERALVEDERLKVILTGPADVIEPFAASHERCSAHATTEAIGMGEHPAEAVRKRKDSSIVVGCRLVKEGEAQGFFSAGSTGAVMAAATLVMGRIKGVKRPCLATIVPSPVRPVIFTDVGANADCKPEYLVQFAQMGSVYARGVLGYDKPSVALLNIGEEDTKGNQLAQEAHALMKEQLPNFAGNAEGRDILKATYEVTVTDGFTGNVALKTIEGTSSVLFHTIKDLMMEKTSTKVAGALLKPSLKGLMSKISADTYGGAPLLGVKGACIVGHGSSNSTAIANGIHSTATAVRQDIAGLIARDVAVSSVDFTPPESDTSNDTDGE